MAGLTHAANIDVYNIVCDSLHIEPVPNNGTLRLPLKPIGLHSDAGAPVLDTPPDLPEHGVGHLSAVLPSTAKTATTATTATTAATAATAKTATTAAAYGVQTSPPQPDRHPGVDDEAGGFDDDDGPQSKSIWEWLRESLEEVKSRIKGMFGGS